MRLIEYQKEFRSQLEVGRNSGKSIGFIPTMGALHDGHLSLIKKARKECDFVVCSIYVNPTQFDVKEDLEKYPRTLESDKELIKEYCDLLFVPKSTEEVYGEKIELKEFDFGGIENELEGEFRPGHFQGMANVVSKFFHIVNPDKAYFGLKDFQQYRIVCKLVEIIDLPIEIVGCDIIREENGLARSSRNERLSEKGREAASVISYALNYISTYYANFSVSKIQKTAKEMIQGILEVEYLEIRDADSFNKIQQWNDSNEVFVSFAGMIDGVRLIDNVRF